MANDKPKRSKRDLWFKLGRFITGLVVLCFFLPFFGVSCEVDGQGMDVITISGTDMVGGCRPGGLAAEAEDQAAKRGKGGDDDLEGGMKVTNVPREPLAIVALALALVVAGLSWVRSRGAMIGAFALSIACVGALAGLYIKVGGDLKKDVDAELGKSGKDVGSKMMKDTKVDSGGRFGLWLTTASLLGIAVLSGLALKEKEEFAALPPPGPPGGPPGAPPGGYPPG